MPFFKTRVAYRQPTAEKELVIGTAFPEMRQNALSAEEMDALLAGTLAGLEEPRAEGKKKV